MTDISTIKTFIENSSYRSHWEKGVKDYALEMISQCDKKNIVSYKQIPNHCNAAHMSDYAIAKALSEGGCFEIYDADIAKRLCTPSELKRHTRKDGTLRDLPHEESWIDVQTRAVYQAILLIKHVCYLYS